MAFTVISIGILFNAFVSATVAATALALTLFLRPRWKRLDPAMQAYAWFWWFTVLVWSGSTIRYLLASIGVAGTTINIFDTLVQTAVFFTGPSLFYYVSMRVFKNEQLAKITSALSVLLGLVALYFLLQPDGIPVRDVTYFSAEGTINANSFLIFTFEAGTIFLLLCYDIARHVRMWKNEQSRGALYHGLYSLTVVIYLVVGSIDESKIITDWPLVIFRMLYTGSFLLVYLIIVQDEASRGTYLVTRDWGSPNALK